MSATDIVAFCAPERGHLQRLLPVIAAFRGRGMTTHVFTDARFRVPIERVGGRFVDLFATRPIEAADATSIPVPCRHVSFAAHYLELVAEEVAGIRPALVVHDTFAVIGPAVATRLDLPFVNICVGHNLEPRATVRALQRSPRVAISPECWRAVRRLREHCGMPNATPFSYLEGMSPYLNICSEPPAFLRDDERPPFEPLAFFGSLLTSELDAQAADHPAITFSQSGDVTLRIYASFGTVVWRFFPNEAMAALAALVDAVGDQDGVAAVISFGGHATKEREQALARQNVEVVDDVHQWGLLEHASVFLTHQGLNSTHEAIYQRVPMIAYPFLGDQPGLAQRCVEFGVSVPLAPSLRAAVSAADVRAALARVAAESALLRAHLDRTRQWEIDTIAARSAVIDRIEGLMRRQ